MGINDVASFDTSNRVTATTIMSVGNNVNAFHIMDAFFLNQNNYVFSTLGDISIGGTDYTRNDLIEYDPTTEAHSLFFNGTLITGGDQFNNLSGASLFDANTLALSVLTGGVPDITLAVSIFNETILFTMIW